MWLRKRLAPVVAAGALTACFPPGLCDTDEACVTGNRCVDGECVPGSRSGTASSGGAVTSGAISSSGPGTSEMPASSGVGPSSSRAASSSGGGTTSSSLPSSSLAPARFYVVAGTASGGQVYAYDEDPANHTWIGSGNTPILSQPVPGARGLAFPGADELVVTSSTESRVFRYSAAGTHVSSDDALASAMGLNGAVIARGNVFVAANGENAVYRYTAPSMATKIELTAASPAGPNGMAVDNEGNIYVTRTGRNDVVRIDPMDAVTPFGSPLSSGCAPTGIALDGQQRVHVACNGDDTIVRWTGTNWQPIIAVVRDPVGLLFRGDYLYVAYQDGVMRYRAASGTQAIVMRSNLGQAYDLVAR